MIGFEYTYKSTNEIRPSLKLITDFTFLELSLLFSLIAFVFLWIFFILPTIVTARNIRLKAASKRKNLNLIKQIAFQRDIEDEIEKEIKEIELKKNGKTS